MRIVYIAAGAGNMYCGACARDVTLVQGLMARGHDVQVVPLYTPLRTDSGDKLHTAPVFYGGLNVYLQNLSPLFRHMPAFAANMLDNPGLLKWASKFAIKTRPQDLGPMTVSVLSGTDGHQRRELDKLMDYLEHDVRPEVVNLTNSLLSGIAPQLKKRLGVPIVCTLQGEDSFVEAIPEPHGSMARQQMRANAQAIDLFLAPGEKYAAKMAGFLGVPASRIKVVRVGVDVDIFRPVPARRREPFTIGYLSVVNPTKGLDLLVDAFALLASEQGRDVRLRVAGKVLRHDYWDLVNRKIGGNGLRQRFEYLGELDLAQKLDFMRSCSVFSVPSRIAESRGMAVMEAMASGVPAVVPNSGVFPEMVELTGGGMLVGSGDVNALAHALASIMDHPKEIDAMGIAGSQGIARYYSADGMAEETIAVYEEVLGIRPVAKDEVKISS